MHVGEQEYEVVSGVSVGAINAHIMSQFPISQEVEATDKMVEFWREIARRNSELVKSWSWGMIYGFFYENSIYDASDLYDFLKKFFRGTKLNRHINIGLANVLTGRFHSFGRHHTSKELIKILQASVSFPGVFKSVEIWDSLWFTGQAIYEIDVLGPINHCRELGYKDEDINVDAIVSGNPKLKSVFANFYNAFGIMERTTEVMDYYEMIFGVVKAQMGHPKVNFRHIIGPPRKMPNRIIPLQFTKDEVENMIKLGQRDVKLYFKDWRSNQQQKKNAPLVPLVMSSNPANADASAETPIETIEANNQTRIVEHEAAPYHCLVRKRYHNPERQKRYENECGKFKRF